MTTTQATEIVSSAISKIRRDVAITEGHYADGWKQLTVDLACDRPILVNLQAARQFSDLLTQAGLDATVDMQFDRPTEVTVIVNLKD